MSRSARTAAASSSATITQPGLPPLDRDVVMGPPPVPAQIAPVSSMGAHSKEGESQEVTEKYRRLKRKYFELEEVRHCHIRVSLPASNPLSPSSSFHRSRNSKTRASSCRTRANAPYNGGTNAGELASPVFDDTCDRSHVARETSLLLERIVELEAQTTSGQHIAAHGMMPYQISSAYPRSLTHPTAQKRFHQNLERALAEAEHEDPSADPIFNSKHVGPNARRRMEAELKERMEEEAREARRMARRPRATRGKEKAPDLPFRESSAVRMESQRQPRGDGRDGAGPPLTLAPAPGSSHFHSSEPAQQVVVSSSGTRLRIKPPAPPNQQAHYMDVDSPPPHDGLSPHEDLGSHGDLARHDHREHSHSSAHDPHPRPLVMSPPLSDPMAHSPLQSRPSRHDVVNSLPPHPETVPVGRSGRNVRSPTPPPTLVRSPVNASYEHNGRLATASEMMAHVSQSPSPGLRQPTSPGLSRSESSNTPPAVAGMSYVYPGVLHTDRPPVVGIKSPLPPQAAYSPNSKYRQVAPAAQAPPSSTQSGPPTSGSQTPASVASPPLGSGQPPVQVYSVTHTPSAPILPAPLSSTMSVTAPKPIDPMGPNGPAAAMMHTFTPIMNPIPPPAIGSPYEQIPRNKPKRLKAHTVTTRSYSIPVVPRDKKGKPILPLNVGIMTVKNLGQICMREHFHTERYIFPVGYEVTRYVSSALPHTPPYLRYATHVFSAPFGEKSGSKCLFLVCTGGTSPRSIPTKIASITAPSLMAVMGQSFKSSPPISQTSPSSPAPRLGRGRSSFVQRTTSGTGSIRTVFLGRTSLDSDRILSSISSRSCRARTG